MEFTYKPADFHYKNWNFAPVNDFIVYTDLLALFKEFEDSPNPRNGLYNMLLGGIVATAFCTVIAMVLEVRTMYKFRIPWKSQQKRQYQYLPSEGEVGTNSSTISSGANDHPNDSD